MNRASLREPVAETSDRAMRRDAINRHLLRIQTAPVAELSDRELSEARTGAHIRGDWTRYAETEAEIARREVARGAEEAARRAAECRIARETLASDPTALTRAANDFSRRGAENVIRLLRAWPGDDWAKRLAMQANCAASTNVRYGDFEYRRLAAAVAEFVADHGLPTPTTQP